VIEGKLTIEEAQVSPLRTILVNAIGVSADVGVEMAHVTLKRDDRLLLCSDGLHDYFPVEEEIAQRLSSEKPGDALKEMVELAKTRGGHDNITGVAVHILEVVESPHHKNSEDTTAPVEAGNPFVDEPTLTAMTNAAGVPVPGSTVSLTNQAPASAASPATTVPLKAMKETTGKDDLGMAPTLPPPMTDKKKTDDGGKVQAPIGTADTGPASSTTPKKS
jgi:hypothetical protein